MLVVVDDMKKGEAERYASMNVSWNGMNSLSVNGIAIYVCSSKLL
jgi:hypothetical protein